MLISTRHLLILVVSWFMCLCKVYANDSPFGEQLTSSQVAAVNKQNDDLYRNSSAKVLRRTKRGVFQLSGIIKCITGCKPLSYRRYGCFCGYMGAGQPIDNIDRCCQEHDHCYSSTSCAHIMVYLLPYQWKCTESGDATCTTLPETKTAASDKCAYQLCECDRVLGNCLKQYECPSTRLACEAQPTQQKEEYLQPTQQKDEY